MCLPWVSHQKDGVYSVNEKLNPVGGGESSFVVAEGAATSKSASFGTLCGYFETGAVGVPAQERMTTNPLHLCASNSVGRVTDF